MIYIISYVFWLVLIDTKNRIYYLFDFMISIILIYWNSGNDSMNLHMRL